VDTAICAIRCFRHPTARKRTTTSLNGDGVDISVAHVHLSTNALMHRLLDKDMLRDIARLRLQGAFDGSWRSLRCHDEGEQYGFTVFLRYEAKSV
jgi:hypothetical protein